jgi:hypothetical protein
MTIEEAIEHTKQKAGMKISFRGALKAGIGNGGSYIRTELGNDYEIARTAWLTGNIEEVAEFFGLYV